MELALVLELDKPCTYELTVLSLVQYLAPIPSHAATALSLRFTDVPPVPIASLTRGSGHEL